MSEQDLVNVLTERAQQIASAILGEAGAGRDLNADVRVSHVTSVGYDGYATNLMKCVIVSKSPFLLHTVTFLIRNNVIVL